MLSTYTHPPTRPMLAHAHASNIPSLQSQHEHKNYPHCEMSSKHPRPCRCLDTPHNITNDTH
nr:MAG TPA: hypothetical protein [Caudoviricetes sp.]